MLSTCNWLAPLAPPWNWLPLKIVTAVSGKMAPNGMRMIGTPGSSTLAGMCHALPMRGRKFVSEEIATRSIFAPSSRIQRFRRLLPVFVTAIVAAAPAVLFVHVHAL